MLENLDTAWIALIGTMFGGAGLKIIENILSRGKDKVDAATAFRDELRKESAVLREEIKAIEKDLDAWKEKYFLLLQEYLEIKSHMSNISPGSSTKMPGEGKKEVEEW